MKCGKPRKGTIAFAVVILLSEFVLYQIDGHVLCYFKGVFGIPCPGCGLGRSFYSLLRLRFKEVFYYHPLFIVVIIIAGVWLLQKRPIIDRIYKSNFFWITVLSLFLGLYFVRMALFFPYTPPMDLNRSALIFKAFPFIQSFLPMH